MRRHVTNGAIQIRRARPADIRQQAENRAFGNACQAGSRAHRAALDQRRDNRDPPGCAQLVHGEPIILYRFSMSSGMRRIHPKTLGCRRLFLGPPSLCRFASYLASALARHGFEASFSANPPTPSAHLRHNLGDKRRASRSGFLGFTDRGENDATSVLHGVELGLSNTLWHTTTQWHGHARSVKLGVCGGGGRGEMVLR